MRLTDLFKVPTNLDINGPDPDRPYRASCPEGDWESDRWVSTARTAREQQWGAGGPDDDRDENRGLFW